MRLTLVEWQIAELYCHGYIDKEIAYVTDKPIWTIRTHKKRIHKKLGIATTHELVLMMVAERVGVNLKLEELHNEGLNAIFK